MPRAALGLGTVVGLVTSGSSALGLISHGWSSKHVSSMH